MRNEPVVPIVKLPAGDVVYTDTGGSGPTFVLLHGVNMDGTLWRDVVSQVRADSGLDARCICPTLPLGAHIQPMRRPEEVTHRGVAALVGDFLGALDLRDVSLVFNDWGGAQFLLADGPADRIAGAVLVACEAFNNFPPGRPGKAIAASARVPALLWAAMQLQRFHWFRRAPGGWGWMSKRPIPDAVMDAWFTPAQRSSKIRRDLRTFALSTPSGDELTALAGKLPSFDKPVLVVWAVEDRVMPRAHGARLAEAFPHARLVEVEDSYTLVPADQPERLASELIRFVTTDLGLHDHGSSA